MVTPKTRADLAKMVPDGGIMIELGVAAGKFAEQLMAAKPAMQYLGVDRWSDHHDEVEMHNAMARLWPWRDRVAVLRSTFEDYLPMVPNGFANLIYIDGYAHTGQEGGRTLDDWWPKVKRGGIFAGHDYHPQYQPTIDAVDAFVAKHNLDLHIIEDQPYPSWWVVKP